MVNTFCFTYRNTFINFMVTYIVYKMHIEMSNFIQVQASVVFSVILGL